MPRLPLPRVAAWLQHAKKGRTPLEPYSIKSLLHQPNSLAERQNATMIYEPVVLPIDGISCCISHAAIAKLSCDEQHPDVHPKDKRLVGHAGFTRPFSSIGVKPSRP